MRPQILLLLLFLTACAASDPMATAEPTTPAPTDTSTPAPSTAIVIVPPTATRPTSTPTPTKTRRPPTATLAPSITPLALGACPDFTSQLLPSLNRGNQVAFVNATSTTPNNVRAAPARSAELVWKAAPGDVLGLLGEAPVCVDGLTWWQVESANGKLQGWTVEGTPDSYWLTPPLAAAPSPLQLSVAVGASTLYKSTAFKIEPRCLDFSACLSLWPDNARLTLRGYVPQRSAAPFIQVVDLAMLRELLSPAFNQQLVDLQAALTARPANPPLVVLTSTLEVLKVQPHYVNFVNGAGVAHVAFWSSEVTPVNNSALYYSFTGLTNDGRYLVLALLPITAPELPANGSQMPPSIPTAAPDGGNTAAVVAAVFAFNDQTATRLAALPPDQFSPKLADLDALLSTLTIEP